jgi:hypothetical protein
LLVFRLRGPRRQRGAPSARRVPRLSFFLHPPESEPMFPAWHQWLKRTFSPVSRLRPKHNNSGRGRKRARPQVEFLEARIQPDSGGGAGQLAAGNLVYSGGPLISQVHIDLIFIKDKTTGSQVPGAEQTALLNYFAKITSDGYITSLLSPLSAGGFTINNGSVNGKVDSGVLVKPDVTLTGNIPAYSDGLIQTTVQNEINSNIFSLNSPRPNDLFFVFTPPGDAVDLGGGATSINTFLGYHSAFGDSNGTDIDFYAVIPDETAINANLGFLGLPPFNGETAVASHEMSEAITDAVPPTGWNDNTFGENGDMAVGQVFTQDGYQVQYEFSNQIKGPAHALPQPGPSDLFINQLAPPATKSFTGGPIATFTASDPTLTAANFSASVFDVNSAGNGSFPWAVSISGSNGFFVVNATPPPNWQSAATNTGQIGNPFQPPQGLNVQVTDTRDIVNGTNPTADRYQPFNIKTNAPLTYNADAGGFPHNFRLVENPATGNFELYDSVNGGLPLLVFTQKIVNTTSIDINADANGVDSSLTIDYSGGVFNIPITFDGGSSAASPHTLTIENAPPGTFTNEVESPTSASGGTITFDAHPTPDITFTNVGKVIDDIVLSGTATYQGTSGNETVNVTNGNTVNGFVSTQIDSGAVLTFPTVIFANKPSVIIDGVDGVDTINLNNPVPANLLTTLELTTGPTAGCVINVQATPATVTTTYVGNNSATVNVGQNGSVQNIKGLVNLENNAANANTIVLDDSLDPAARTITLQTAATDPDGDGDAFGQVTGLSAFTPINYEYADTNSLTVNGSLGGDTLNVLATNVPTTTYVGASPTSITVGTAGSVQAIQGNLNLENPAGALNTIVVDDSADNLARNIVLSQFANNPSDSQGNADLYGKIHGLSALADINYEYKDTTGVTIKGNSGGGTLLVQATGAGMLTDFIGEGNTAVTVSQLGTVQNLKGTLILENPVTPTALLVDDSADTVARTTTLSTFGTDPSDSEGNNDAYGQIVGLAPATIFFEYPDTSKLTIKGSSGGGKFNVPVTQVPTNFVGAGATTVNVGSIGSVQGIMKTLNLESPSGGITVVVDDSADTTARSVTLGTLTPDPSDSQGNGDVYGTITGLAPAAIDYEFKDTPSITVKGTGGGGTVAIQAAGTVTSYVAGGNTNITVGNAGSVQNITSTLTLENPGTPGGNTVVVNDSADTTARTVTLSTLASNPNDSQGNGDAYGKVHGLAPADILVEYSDTSSLTIGASGGGGTLNIQATVINTNLLITAATVVNIGGAGSLQTIQGALNLENPTTGGNVITLDDSADSTARTVTLSTFINPNDSQGNNDLWGMIAGLAPAPISYEYADTKSITIKGGTGGDVLNVQGTGAASTTFVGAGNSTINVGNAGSAQGIVGALNLENPTKLNTIVVDDSADSTARTVTLGTFTSNPTDSQGNADAYGQVTGLAPAAINFEGGDTKSIAIKGGTGGGSLLVQGTVAGTTTSFVGGGAITVTVGNAHNVQSVNGTLNLEDPVTQFALTLDDSADTQAHNITLGTLAPNPADSQGNADPYGQVTGLAPAAINFEYNDTSSLTLIGSGGGGSLAIQGINIPTTIVLVNNTTISLSNLQTITNPLNLENKTGKNTIILDDSADSTARTITLSTLVPNPSDPEGNNGPFGQVLGLAPAAINYEYADTTSLTIKGGTGGDTVNVLATGVPVTYVGGGTSTINVGTGGTLQSIAGALNLENPAAKNTVNIDDSADATTRTVTLSSFTAPTSDSQGNNDSYGKIQGLGAADVNYELQDTGNLMLKGGSGNNTFNIGSSSAGLTTITAGAGNDTFNVTAALAGTGQLVLDGGTGSNTLTGPNQTDTWNITAANKGNIGGVVTSFSNMANLVGGSSADSFVFSDAATISGTVNGGGGADTLNNSAYTTSTNVVLSGTGSIDGFAGTAPSVTGGFDNIEAVRGGTTSNSLTGLGTDSTWTVNGASSQYVNGANTLGFTGFQTLDGGAGVDTFDVQSLTGPTTLNGNGGDDVFVVSSATNTLDGLAGMPLTIDGGAGANQLSVSEAGRSADDTISVTGTQISSSVVGFTINYTATGGDFSKGVSVTAASGNNAIAVLGTAASAPTTVSSGAGNDAFTISSPTSTLDTLHAPLSIDAGGGSNLLNVSEAGRLTADSVALSDTQISSTVVGFSISYTASGGGNFLQGVNLTVGSGNNIVDIQGTTANAPTTVTTGPGNSNFLVSGLDGTLSAFASGLTITAGPGADQLVVSDTGNAGDNSYTFSDTQISAGAFSVNYTAAGNFSRGVALVTSLGNTSINVQGTPANAPTTIVSGEGNAAIMVSGGDGTLSTFASPMTVVTRGGSNQLVVSEANDTTGDNIVFGPNQIASQLGRFVVDYVAAGGSYSQGVALVTGSGSSVIYVEGTAPNAPTTIAAVAGNNTFVVTSVSGTLSTFASPMTIDAGAGHGKLVVSEAFSTVADNVIVSSNQIASLLGTFAINYVATGGDYALGVSLFTGGGNDVVTLTSPTPGPTFINTEGGNDLVRVNVTSTSNYSGVTLDGGPGNNVLDVEDLSGTGIVRAYPSSPTSGVVQAIYSNSRSILAYFGFPTITGSTNAERNYIQALFHQILGRNASPGELAAFIGVLESQGRLTVVLALEHSAEGRTHLVDSWFVRFLGHPPVNGQEQPFVRMLLAGQSEEDVLGALLGNPGQFHSAPFRAQEVQANYARLLQRPASLAEQNAWVFTSLTIESIRELLEISDEFFFNGV